MHRMQQTPKDGQACEITSYVIQCQHIVMNGVDMSKTATINMRVSPETKSKAESLFSSFGMTLTEAINIFLHKSIMVGGLPFDVREPNFNQETLDAIQEARDIMSGKAKAKVYSSVDEMFADLDLED